MFRQPRNSDGIATRLSLDACAYIHWMSTRIVYIWKCVLFDLEGYIQTCVGKNIPWVVSFCQMSENLPAGSGVCRQRPMKEFFNIKFIMLSKVSRNAWGGRGEGWGPGVGLIARPYIEYIQENDVPSETPCSTSFMYSIPISRYKVTMLFSLFT